MAMMSSIITSQHPTDITLKFADCVSNASSRINNGYHDHDQDNNNDHDPEQINIIAGSS